jgi:hypothetical protein
MPGIRVEGFRLMINTRDERGHRPHVHVIKAEFSCKIRLDPTLTAYEPRMRSRDIQSARELVATNFAILMNWWNQYNETLPPG